MKRQWVVIAGIALLTMMASAFTVGCGPDQPEYDRAPRPVTPQQQPQQQPTQEDTSSQQPLPAQPQGK